MDTTCLRIFQNIVRRRMNLARMVRALNGPAAIVLGVCIGLFGTAPFATGDAPGEPDCPAAFAPVLPSSGLDGFNGFRVTGVTPSGQFGYTVALGDVNGDGLADIIVGAFLDQASGDGQNGSVYVIFGRPGVGGPAEISVGDIDGTNGFVIHGPEGQTWFGLSVASGDVNGDGFDDVLVGAPFASFERGVCYVVFGRAAPVAEGTLYVDSLDGTNGFLIKGRRPEDWNGWSVAFAGDVNADGVGEALVGAPFDQGSSHSVPSGAAFLVWGRVQAIWPVSFQLESWEFQEYRDFGDIDFSLVFSFNPGNMAGVSVAGLGDVNGDGIGDYAVGAPRTPFRNGDVYVLFGRTGPEWDGYYYAHVVANEIHPSLGGNGSKGALLKGAEPGDEIGWYVGPAGDVNSDGINDILVGAASAYAPSPRNASEAYLVFGRDNSVSIQWTAFVRMNLLDGVNGVALEGVDAQDQLGLGASGCGDVDDDGASDFVIGASSAGVPGGDPTGRTWTVMGQSTTWPARMAVNDILPPIGDEPIGFLTQGGSFGEGVGTSAAGRRDINGDGVPDYVIGAPGTLDSTGNQIGAVIATFGRRDCNQNGTNDACELFEGLGTDCNENGFLDGCDLANGTSEDLNGTNVPDECDDCVFENDDCDDSDVCTQDACAAGVCSNPARMYGDVNHDGGVDMFDILCVLDGFAALFQPPCTLSNVDILPCPGGDGLVDAFDILGVLDAFGGVFDCDCPVW
ncbi:MAG: hypothetical protein HOP29_03530 [Phycisphaerales bacterium]|nr:hypothetical protein [Phycisphaerales bacterium]